MNEVPRIGPRDSKFNSNSIPLPKYFTVARLQFFAFSYQYSLYYSSSLSIPIPAVSSPWLPHLPFDSPQPILSLQHYLAVLVSQTSHQYLAHQWLETKVLRSLRCISTYAGVNPFPIWPFRMKHLFEGPGTALCIILLSPRRPHQIAKSLRCCPLTTRRVEEL